MTSTLFGLPQSSDESEIVILSLPWNANASEPTSTDEGIHDLVEVSSLIDFYHHDFPDVWRYGISIEYANDKVISMNKDAKECAQSLMALLNESESATTHSTIEQLKSKLTGINNDFLKYAYTWCKTWIEKEKLVGVLGGDHSVSLGYISMVADHCDNFGVLQLDAHCDLRAGYLENDFSHASVMYHVSKLASVKRLVQVGVRDYCEEEVECIKNSQGKIKTFFDYELKDQLFQGKSWQSICKKIGNALPEKIYISFDIDALTPDLCPNTGTPVPGGLSFEQVSYLFHTLHTMGKQIIGFDLVEVGQDSTSLKWDAKVASRILYTLCGYYSLSNYES